MGEAITTRPGAKWTSVIKPEVTRGETCKFRVVLKASDDVAWTGTTATAQIRKETGELVFEFAQQPVTLEPSGQGTVILQATAEQTETWPHGKHFAGVRVVSPEAGTIDLPNFFLVVHNGAVQ